MYNRAPSLAAFISNRHAIAPASVIAVVVADRGSALVHRVRELRAPPRASAVVVKRIAVPHREQDGVERAQVALGGVRERGEAHGRARDVATRHRSIARSIDRKTNASRSVDASTSTRNKSINQQSCARRHIDTSVRITDGPNQKKPASPASVDAATSDVGLGRDARRIVAVVDRRADRRRESATRDRDRACAREGRRARSHRRAARARVERRRRRRWRCGAHRDARVATRARSRDAGGGRRSTRRRRRRRRGR